MTPQDSVALEPLAGPAVAPVMAALHASAFAEPWPEASFAEILAMPGVAALAVREGAEPAGFILWRTVLDEAEILTLAVHSGARRRGYGRQLVGRMIACLREAGVSRLFLEVASDNVAAQALYRATGFQETGRRKGYYRTPSGVMDALLMETCLA